jgi:hypothetical protein
LKKRATLSDRDEETEDNRERDADKGRRERGGWRRGGDGVVDRHDLTMRVQGGGGWFKLQCCPGAVWVEGEDATCG